MSLKDEKRVIAVSNVYFKSFDFESTADKDQYCVYDAEDENHILEIKVRKKDYGDVAVEVRKIEALLAKARELGKIPYLLVVNDSGYHFVDIRTKFRVETYDVKKTTDFYSKNNHRKPTEFAVWNFDTLTIPQRNVAAIERKLGYK